MPQHAATIESLPMTCEMVKEMQADGLDGSAMRDRRNGFYWHPTYAPINSQIGSQA